MAATRGENPFRIHGVVTEQFFTDRAAELDRIGAALREPAAKLLVYGPRRMGKTSALVRAIARHEKTGGVAFLADMSTASTLVDVANRILEAAGRALGRKWRDAISDFVGRLGMTISLTPDPGSGLILPSLDVRLRSATLEEQRTSLSKTLDSIDALAKARKTTIGVVLDEFQEIQRFGGEAAEWHLRGVIQHHQQVSYVLAGSQARIIERMLDKGRAFYGLADQLLFGPIDPEHLASWIEARLSKAGVSAAGVGSAIVALAGPRTRDIVQVARKIFDNCKLTGRAGKAAVPQAFDDVVTEQEALFQSTWQSLRGQQQNILRAVAAGLDGLTTRASLRRFGLTSSGAASNAAAALVEAGHLVRAESPTGYGFESPFFAHWVRRETMADLGAALPAPDADEIH
jgi:hypothetical protein